MSFRSPRRRCRLVREDQLELVLGQIAVGEPIHLERMERERGLPHPEGAVDCGGGDGLTELSPANLVPSGLLLGKL